MLPPHPNPSDPVLVIVQRYIGDLVILGSMETRLPAAKMPFRTFVRPARLIPMHALPHDATFQDVLFLLPREHSHEGIKEPPDQVCHQRRRLTFAVAAETNAFLI
jgi:hypothetical protein